MKSFLVLCFIAYCSCLINLSNWENFKAYYGRDYKTPSEERTRYAIFQSTLKYIREFNSEGHSFTLGVNQFSDMTNEEYREYLGSPITVVEPFINESVVNFGDIDWRQKGAVTGVKDQGQCGSCWCFGTVGCAEGAHVVKGNSLVSLSEQQVLDCTTQNNNGCNGGDPRSACSYVIKAGLESEATYPYHPQKGSCKYNAASVVAKYSSMVSVTAYSETDLQNKVTQYGPAEIAIDASHSSFQSYRNGIYYEPACSQTNLDHAVTCVGFAASYYIVKNSWGTGWGMQGYIEMSKGRNNNCGVASYGLCLVGA